MLAPIVDCQVPLNPPAHEYIAVSSFQQAIGNMAEGIRYGDFVVRLPSGSVGFELEDELTDPNLPVDVVLIDDNHGQGGTWYQTFTFTINPMGTLADVSTIVYGDEGHVNEIFTFVQKQYPDLSSPARIQAGQKFDLTIDASRTNVLKTSVAGSAKNSAIKTYFNGLKETIAGDTNTAVVRIIEFPVDVPVDQFRLGLDGREIPVPRGNKFIEFQYKQGDSFEETVKAAYGALSSRAIQDFEQQTRWSFDRWPPADNDTAEAIVSLTRSYQDEAFQVLQLSLVDPVADGKFQELLAARSKAGIYPIKQQPDGIIYRVTVLDSSITAKKVSKLLYNSENAFLDIADSAGVRLETTDPNRVKPDFDVALIGRSFDVHLDYADEQFILSEQQGAGENLLKRITLLNGTVIDVYKASEKQTSGVQQIAYYPNGYHRISYQPDEATYSVFDFLYFTMRFGNIEDQEDHDTFVGAMIWNWQSDIPKSAGDVTEQLALQDSGKGKMLHALVWHRDNVTFWEFITYRWWSLNPFLALLTLVFASSALFMAVVIAVRKINNIRSSY